MSKKGQDFAGVKVWTISPRAKHIKVIEFELFCCFSVEEKCREKGGCGESSIPKIRINAALPAFPVLLHNKLTRLNCRSVVTPYNPLGFLLSQGPCGGDVPAFHSAFLFPISEKHLDPLHILPARRLFLSEWPPPSCRLGEVVLSRRRRIRVLITFEYGRESGLKIGTRGSRLKCCSSWWQSAQSGNGQCFAFAFMGTSGGGASHEKEGAV